MATKDRAVVMDIPADAIQPIYSFEKKMVDALIGSGLQSTGITGVGTYLGIHAISGGRAEYVLNNATALDSMNPDELKKVAKLAIANIGSKFEEFIVLLSKVYLEFEKNKQGSLILELLETTDMMGDKLWNLFNDYYKQDMEKMLYELHCSLSVVTACIEVEKVISSRGSISIREIASEEF